jgi:ornithine carbamoyltransferase
MTANPAVPAHFLRVSDLDAGGLRALLDLATEMKERRHGFVEELKGETLVCFFEKPSTRTRLSFAAAAERLGMLPVVLGPADLQLERGESLEDTARTFAGYAAAIVVRTFAQETVERMAAVSRVPVVNALTDEHHPCQALADLLTMRERFGRLEGVRVAFIGDFNNVATSLAEAAALTGVHVTVACPSGYERVVHDARVVHEPAEAVRGADVVYTDVWVSMGDEAARESHIRDLGPFRVDEALMSHASPDAVFMHCLPAHRGEEVAQDVIDGPHSIVWQQAENRMPTEEALLFALIRRRWE